MSKFAMQAIGAGVDAWLWLWVVPRALLGSVGRRRMYLRLLRPASRRVKAALTRYRRGDARAFLRWLLTGRLDGVRPRGAMVYDGPGEFVPPSASFDALVQLAAGRAPVPGPPAWAPVAIGRRPTRRCDACPAFGCDACRKDSEPSLLRALLDVDASRERIVDEVGVDIGDGGPANPTRSCGRCRQPLRSADAACQCPQPLVGSAPHIYSPGCACRECTDVISYQEVTTHEQNKPVAYIPAGRIIDQWREEEAHHRADRDRLAALIGAAEPPPGERAQFRRRPSGARCGACDGPVRYFEGEPPSIGHAVGCPRRSWPLDRATLPRPGHDPRPGPRSRTLDEVYIAADAAISCGCYDLDRHRPSVDTMWPYRPGSTDRVRK